MVGHKIRMDGSMVFYELLKRLWEPGYWAMHGCWGFAVCLVCFGGVFPWISDQSVRSSYQPMTSLAYLHDCHCCYNERSFVQKKKHYIMEGLRDEWQIASFHSLLVAWTLLSLLVVVLSKSIFSLSQQKRIALESVLAAAQRKRVVLQMTNKRLSVHKQGYTTPSHVQAKYITKTVLSGLDVQYKDAEQGVGKPF